MADGVRILCVDDEPNVLAALERTLHDRFAVVTAPSGEKGLELMEANGPFTVVVSDMRMPGMDGASFLARARGRFPDTVRVLLTGHANVPAAVAAINDGGVFRFLTKPCPPDVLLETLEQAVAKHWFAQAERELLETTLRGTIHMLTQILAVASPWAFHRAAFAEACVRHALRTLRWREAWMYEAAASLSQIGWVGLPQDLVLARGDEALPARDAALLASHAEIAWRLLAPIPRLDRVAEIVRYQNAPPPAKASSDVTRGAELLRAALAMEDAFVKNMPAASINEHLRRLRPLPSDAVIAAMDGFRAEFSELRAASVRDLVAGWVLDEDVRTRGGLLLLPRGQELTEPAILSLRRMRQRDAIVEPIRVRLRARPPAN